MPRMIDAEALRHQLANIPMHGDEEQFYAIMGEIAREVNAAPTVDPERHGWWAPENITCNHAKEFRCSGDEGCGRVVEYDHYTRFCDYDYCPNCGAKMDQEVPHA